MPIDQLIPGGLGAVLGAPGSGSLGGLGDTGGTSGSPGGANDAQYSDCVAAATTPEALAKCAEQL